MKQVTEANLLEAIRAHVDPSARVMTDQHWGYVHVGREFEHHSVSHLQHEWVRGDAHTQTVEDGNQNLQNKGGFFGIHRVSRAFRGYGLRGGDVMQISPGSRLLVRTAFGDEVERRAVSGIEQGDKFPIVRVSTEEEWERAKAEGREPQADPWPVEYVRVVEAASG